jgi:hypothetical protein
MTNPLIEKFYELHPEKKEKPKVIKDIRFAQEYECEFIKAENPKTSLTTYDPDSVKVSFQQIAEKVKNGEAQVSSMSMEMDIMSGTKITFEVYVNRF